MEKLKLKSLKIDNEIHKKLKIYCVENDVKITHILEILILEYLKKNNSDDNN